MKDNFVFLDSNVCLYLLNEESTKKRKAEELLALENPVISLQVVNETINIGIKKFKIPPQELISHIDFLLLNCDLVNLSILLQKKAIDLHYRYQFSYYDSLIISAALEARCSILYSEDMQHGMVVEDKLTIINPFT
jgi:predicted nucleic acid-binding protein